MEDKDISDEEWNLYLTKYKDKYVTKLQKNGIRCFKCKHGTIEPFSLTTRYLGYWGYYETSRQKNTCMNKLPDYVETTIDCDTEFGCKFPENKLIELENIFKINKKKELTRKTKRKLRKNIKKARKYL